jgi:hypothetical protein
MAFFAARALEEGPKQRLLRPFPRFALCRSTTVAQAGEEQRMFGASRERLSRDAYARCDTRLAA